MQDGFTKRALSREGWDTHYPNAFFDVVSIEPVSRGP